MLCERVDKSEKKTKPTNLIATEHVDVLAKQNTESFLPALEALGALHPNPAVELKLWQAQHVCLLVAHVAHRNQFNVVAHLASTIAVVCVWQMRQVHVNWLSCRAACVRQNDTHTRAHTHKIEVNSSTCKNSLFINATLNSSLRSDLLKFIKKDHNFDFGGSRPRANSFKNGSTSSKKKSGANYTFKKICVRVMF